jgi:hypothetical protein
VIDRRSRHTQGRRLVAKEETMMRRTAPLLLALVLGCAGELDPDAFLMRDGATATNGGSDGGGAGGGAAVGCAEAPGIFKAHLCDACHDAKGQYANFDMASPGWEMRLVGVKPKGGGATSPSVCATAAKDYLVAGSNPATGLFIDKLKPTTASSCGEQMPTAGEHLSANELACVQRWADALTAR